MDDEEQETDADRRRFNIVLLMLFLVIAGSGIWLARAMVDARRADDCIAQGRRNCVPITAPAR